jgi:cytochrome c oxidase accessory protein FixG
MFDRDTLIVSYDAERGDPRGKRSKRIDPAAQGLGSCVDCRLCVSACPTGIDIRNGLQYECIDCAACVDVCNGVMKKMGYAPNLIRFSSENLDRGLPRQGIRFRLWGSGALLAALFGVLAFELATRVPLELDVIRDRSRLYRENWDGSVENSYELRIMNMEQRSRTYEVRVDGAVPMQYTGETRIEVAGGSQVSVPVSLLTAPGVHAAPNFDVHFTIESVGAPARAATKTSRFLRPVEADSGLDEASGG